MTWHAGAACHPDRKPAHMTAQEWNRIWFPNPTAPVGMPPENRSTVDMYATARTYCGECPVREQCLIDAQLNGDKIGMFGGLSPNERRDLRWRPRRCRWCDEVFTVDLPPKPRRGGVLPSFCCEEHRQASREQSQAAFVERRARLAEADVDTECQICGHVSRSASGLWQHMQRRHGEVAA